MSAPVRFGTHTSRQNEAVRISPAEEVAAGLPRHIFCVFQNHDGGINPPLRFFHTFNASECMRLSPESRQERDADMPDGGTSEPPQGQQTAAFGERTQNRGNEAEKSLKTNEVGKTMCAKPTHSCARNARIEAKKEGFLCRPRLLTQGSSARAIRTLRGNRGERVSMTVNQSVAAQN
jgi:hypothetical protein